MAGRHHSAQEPVATAGSYVPESTGDADDRGVRHQRPDQPPEERPEERLEELIEELLRREAVRNGLMVGES